MNPKIFKMRTSFKNIFYVSLQNVLFVKRRVLNISEQGLFMDEYKMTKRKSKSVLQKTFVE